MPFMTWIYWSERSLDTDNMRMRDTSEALLVFEGSLDDSPTLRKWASGPEGEARMVCLLMYARDIVRAPAICVDSPFSRASGLVSSISVRKFDKTCCSTAQNGRYLLASPAIACTLSALS